MPTKVCRILLHFSLQTTKSLVLHSISLRLAQQSFQEWLNLPICICQVTVGPYKLVRAQWWKRENIFLSWGRAGSQGPIFSCNMWKGIGIFKPNHIKHIITIIYYNHLQSMTDTNGYYILHLSSPIFVLVLFVQKTSRHPAIPSSVPTPFVRRSTVPMEDSRPHHRWRSRELWNDATTFLGDSGDYSDEYSLQKGTNWAARIVPLVPVVL